MHNSDPLLKTKFGAVINMILQHDGFDVLIACVFIPLSSMQLSLLYILETKESCCPF